MIINKLFLNNYRNFRREQIHPDHKFNIIWGDNAQGKTNLLEAIYLLSNLKSFRTNKHDELILQGEQQANISAEIDQKGVFHHLSIGFDPQNKFCRINGKNPGSAGAFLGFFKTVLFAPEEVGLIRAFPAGRRTLLDRAIFFVSPDYLKLARDYQRQLKQRNRLLKETQDTRGLKPWTEGLIINGARLRRARIEYLKRINSFLRETYSSICLGTEEIDICYPNQDGDNLEETLEREFAGVSAREWRYQQTLAGPHRDDVQFILDGLSLKNYGSQGQQRSAILAFKCAQVIDLEQQIGEPPVLLLDDLSSELDPGRRRAFFEFVQHRKGQVFLTTTDISLLKSSIGSSAREFKLKAGMVVEKH
jgi:DNA replication and repair protein RecF